MSPSMYSIFNVWDQHISQQMEINTCTQIAIVLALATGHHSAATGVTGDALSASTGILKWSPLSRVVHDTSNTIQLLSLQEVSVKIMYKRELNWSANQLMQTSTLNQNIIIISFTELNYCRILLYGHHGTNVTAFDLNRQMMFNLHAPLDASKLHGRNADELNVAAR